MSNFRIFESMLKKRLFATFVAIIFSSIGQCAFAETVKSTIDRIANTGKIRIGYGNTPPFSYVGPDGQVIGYSIDICKRLASSLQRQLGLAQLDIEYVPRTPSNRIQLLNDGAIDIECNSSTNTAERRKSVAFSYSHFIVSTRYVALASQGLSTLEDLRGRSVSVALGTVNVGQINAVNRERKLNLSIVPADSLQAAFDMVGNGNVSAFAMDEVLLSTMIAESTTPSDYTLSSEMVAEPQPYGFMVRLGDEGFITAVNKSLAEIYKSPEMENIYQNWFERPIPGSGINLRLPLSEQMKQSFSETQ